jgi:hypothetical protein
VSDYGSSDAAWERAVLDAFDEIARTSDTVSEKLDEMAQVIATAGRRHYSEHYTGEPRGFITKGIRVLRRRGADGMPWRKVTIPAGSLFGARKGTREQVNAWGHPVRLFHPATDMWLSRESALFDEGRGF